MKRFILDFLHRGAIASGFGPVVLAIVYLALQHSDVIDTLTVDQVCLGIISITLLAFIAGGINVIYQIERLKLMTAIFIHGCVLYVGYLLTYLLNDWLDFGMIPVIVFSSVFVIAYIIIWIIIYSVIKRNTAKVNKMLEKKQNGL